MEVRYEVLHTVQKIFGMGSLSPVYLMLITTKTNGIYAVKCARSASFSLNEGKNSFFSVAMMLSWVPTLYKRSTSAEMSYTYTDVYNVVDLYSFGPLCRTVRAMHDPTSHLIARHLSLQGSSLLHPPFFSLISANLPSAK